MPSPQMTPRKFTQLRHTLLLVSLFYGVIAMALSGHLYYRYQSYQPTRATITALSLTHHRPAKGPKGYSPRVLYTYSIKGRLYTGDRYAPLTYSYPHKEAAHLLTSYQVGQTVTVYVSPRNPAKSYLRHDLPTAFMAILFFPVLFFALLYFLTRYRFHQYLQKQKSRAPRPVSHLS